MNQYTLIPVSKNLSTLFFFRHFLFIILGKVNWKGVKELKFALLSVQVKMYLRNLLTRIWFFQKTVARKLTLKLFFSTVLCIAQVSNHLKYISSTKMSRKKLVLNLFLTCTTSSKVYSEVGASMLVTASFETVKPLLNTFYPTLR